MNWKLSTLKVKYFFGSHIHVSTGHILENLSVRISDPWVKSAPRKTFEILFWLETSKKTTPEGGVRL